MKNKILIGIHFIVAILCISCSKLLDEKTDIKMVIPETLADAELLLNDYTTMNTGFPAFGEISSENYYITDEIFDGSLNIDQQNFYKWADQPYNDAMAWQRSYKAVFNANQVLDMLSKLPAGQDIEQKNKLLGAAHFYRAFAFQQIAEVFAPSYQESTATTDMGIPIRLDPAVDAVSKRSSLKKTFEQIIQDYKVAALHLSDQEIIIGRPIRASAYAGLARAYLTMSDFEYAYLFADSCLQLHPALMNFNVLDKDEDLPIPQYNEEILFLAMTGAAGPMSYINNMIDPPFYDSYQVSDLRRKIFFQEREEQVGTYRYRGNYDRNKALLFIGLTSSEMYLIKAEAAVRLGKIKEALSTLNTLLSSRFTTNQYVPVKEVDPEKLLLLTLKEREKELLFRGRRWSDLKRLNQDPRFKKILKRFVKGIEYTLEPNSLKYAFRLPEPVVNIGNIPQNLR